MADQAHATRDTTRDNIQAHLLRPSKFQVGGSKSAERNWSLFFFFRILRQAEFDAMMDRMQSATKDDPDAKYKLWQDFAQTAFANAGIVEERLAKDPGSEPDRPADAFLKWLRAIVSADKSGIKSTADSMVNCSRPASTPAAKPTKERPALAPNVPWRDPNSWIPHHFEIHSLDVGFLQDLVRVYAEPGNYAAELDLVRDSIKAAVPQDPLGPLSLVTLYEILRQCAPAMMSPADPGEPSPGVVRGEKAGAPAAPVKDGTPINIAFTYSGLSALKMNAFTLASFPDAFKQGMAARAERLHDTGPSAPDAWEGELGLPSVHGYFTGGFALSDGNAANESFWKAMRRDVKAFNNPVDDHGRMLRFGFRILFRLFGLEILHIELGQYPYEVDKEGTIKELDHRLEHFGFRDGLSQPFVDMGLRDVLPGGGTPGRDYTWRPVAPGEIFLNLPDENGEVQSLPICKDLSLGSTFLVFRKLEQDVARFRAFLGRMRPKDKEAQKALSAQFVGRWPNGVPLVLSPDQERFVDEEMEAILNDFRYAADDPVGKKCPLGAHIRRANPRDIGGRGEVRRHRILRRGISYGGPLLKGDALDDGEKRGLLFIAANSRIDLQFEVVQSNWINGGEFLGQAGLGRCPLTGDHDGSVADSFIEAGATAPVTGLPRFVTTRGGDYFFAPGIKALRKIAEGNRFVPENGEIPFAGFSQGDAATPALFDLRRLQGYGQAILKGPRNAIQVELPNSGTGPSDKLWFIGRYQDVKTVLNNLNESGQLAFSVRQYSLAGRDITRGLDLIVGTEDVEPTQHTRNRLHKILYRAWNALEQAHPGSMEDLVRGLARSATEDALRRTAHARRIDLVSDLAAQASYAIVAKLYGISGPAWVTEISASLPFAHQHVGELPPEWITSLMGKESGSPGLMTLQIWSNLILADLIGNVQSLKVLHSFSRQAGAEMLNYIDAALLDAKTTPIESPRTLVESFVKIEKCSDIEELYVSSGLCEGGDWRPVYYRDVSAVLLEIVGTTMASIPMAFASVIEGLFKFHLELATLVKPGDDVLLSHIIYEADRLNPTLGVRIRRCERETKLGDTLMKPGEWVVSLIGAANQDPDEKAFPEPLRFKLDRDIDRYLLFNEARSSRVCWGRDRVAMVVLQECVKAAARLHGLRRVAGKRGEPKKLGGITVSLPARFTKLAKSPSCEPVPASLENVPRRSIP